MNEEEKKDIKSIIVPTIGILAIVIAYFLVDYNNLYQSFKGEAKFVIQDKNCNLHKNACTIKIQDGTIFELSVEPKTIALMKPLKFSVKSNNAHLENLHLNIYAINMFMGEFTLPLKNLGNGIYEAKGTLPTCPTGDMQWNADIRVDKLDKTIGARFQFKTDI